MNANINVGSSYGVCVLWATPQLAQRRLPLQPPRKPLQFLFDLGQNSLVPPSPLPPCFPYLPLHLCLCPCGSPSLPPPPTSAARPTPASAPHLCFWPCPRQVSTVAWGVVGNGVWQWGEVDDAVRPWLTSQVGHKQEPLPNQSNGKATQNETKRSERNRNLRPAARFCYGKFR